MATIPHLKKSETRVFSQEWTYSEPPAEDLTVTRQKSGSNGALEKEHIDRIAVAWSSSRRRIARTLSRLSSTHALHDHLQSYAKKYFLRALKPGDRPELERRLTLLSRGLTAALSVAVADQYKASTFEDLSGGDYDGWVPYCDAMPGVSGAIPSLEPTNTGAPNYHVKGNIFLSKKILFRNTREARKQRYVNVTLIHEATHKFVGTWDYCYFDDDGVAPRSRFDSQENAFNNADSLAWFTYHGGRRHNRMVSYRDWLQKLGLRDDAYRG